MPHGKATSGLITALWQSLPQANLRWLRYGLASAVALTTDAGLFLILLESGINAMAASSLGYATGIIVHWLVSSRLVFADGAAARGTSRRGRQKALFVGSAAVGLGLTTAIVGAGTYYGLDPRLAKLIAIAVSFQATYMLRRHVVFRG